MADLLGLLGDWTWWIIAVVLLVSELLVMSIFLVWLGLAALTVGLVDLLLGLDWQMEVLLFVVASVIYLWLGRRYVKTRAAGETDQPHLNQRMQSLVGRTAVLHEAIVNGQGKVQLDDAIWRVTGEDAPAGTRVRITGADGLVLQTEPA
jgi:membrane protein implicated in regulation of membrane protease activity